MSEYFPEQKSLGKMNIELDLSSYVTTDFKNGAGIHTSSFAKKLVLASLKYNIDKLNIDKLKIFPTNLSNLKSKVDKLDVDKILPLSVNLSKLSGVVKNDDVQKDAYNAKNKNIEDKIPNITR